MSPSATRRWTLRSRVRTALLAAGAVFGVLLVLASVALVQVNREQSRVTEVIFRAVLGMEEAHAMLVDAEAAVRAYSLTADPTTLAPYERLDPGALARGAEQAVVVLPGDPELADALSDLVAAVEAWDTRYARPTVERAAAEGPDPQYPANRPLGRELFADVRDGLDRTLDALMGYRAETTDSLARWRSLLLGSFALLALASVVVGTGLWLFLRAWVTDPLERLAAASRVVADGNLERRVEAQGPEEIVALGEDVERMRRRLVTELEASRQARAELETSNRDLEQFAYVASHDLQEPLRKVASFTQLLQRRYGGQLDERADQYIEFAVDGAKRMQRLIQDLLTFSRVGRTEEQRGAVDLDACLRDALENLSETLETTGARVTADPLPTVLGHAGVLTQLFQNLVGNALKFRSPERPPLVHLSASRTREGWELACTDNGIGIEPRHAERVFVIFQRLHAKEVYGGTGIGLALCKRIVEMHGGRIWVVPTEEGQVGTTLRWTLPAVDVPSAGGAAEPAVVENAPDAARMAAPARATEAP